MTQQTGVPPHHHNIERAIVFQLLRTDHDEPWSRTALAAELDEVELGALATALESLREHGVLLEADSGVVRASPAARRLDTLEVIGV